MIIASRLGPIDLVPPTHRPNEYRTVSDVLRNLPALKAGEAFAADPLHRRLSSLNLTRIRASCPPEVRGGIGHAGFGPIATRRERAKGTRASMGGWNGVSRPRLSRQNFTGLVVADSDTRSKIGAYPSGGRTSSIVSETISLCGRRSRHTFQKDWRDDRKCGARLAGRGNRQNYCETLEALGGVRDGIQLSGSR